VAKSFGAIAVFLWLVPTARHHALIAHPTVHTTEEADTIVIEDAADDSNE